MRFPCIFRRDMKYIWALDVSMKNTGVSIFTNDGKHCDTFSIETGEKDLHQKRLKYLYDEILKKRKKYKPELVVIEEGFFRFIRSTQVLFRAFGVVQLAFHDVEQTLYQSTTIKKIVAGRGNCGKDDLKDAIHHRYPKIKFKNFDESDSFATGLTYFIKKGILDG